MPEHDVVTQTSAEQLLALRNATDAIIDAVESGWPITADEAFKIACKSLYGRETGLVVDVEA